MDERYFEVVVFLVDFALIIAIHHIEMISFIKFFPVIRFFSAAAHAGRSFMFLLFDLNWC
jgi:hypothetical protein